MPTEVTDFDTTPPADAGQQPPTTPPPAPTPPVVVDARAVVGELLRELNRPAATPAQKSAMESEIESLVAEGYNKDALKVIIRLREAERRDNAAQAQHFTAQQLVNNFQAQINSMSWEALEQFEDIPGVTKAKAGIYEDYHRIIHTDPEFAGEIAKINAGQLPSKRAVSKAMAKAVDQFCKETGIQKPQSPVSMKHSKPAAPTAGGGDPSTLDPSQRKLFNALKGILGEQRALERAKAATS